MKPPAPPPPPSALFVPRAPVPGPIGPVGASSRPHPPRRPPGGGKEEKPAAVITMDKGGRGPSGSFPAGAPPPGGGDLPRAGQGRSAGGGCPPGGPTSGAGRRPPKGDGTGGPGYTIKAEFNKQKHERGAVAMARTSAPNSAGSQFYFTLAPSHFLDGQYTVFGKVTSGMDVVDKIKVGDKMKSVKITEAAQ